MPPQDEQLSSVLARWAGDEPERHAVARSIGALERAAVVLRRKLVLSVFDSEVGDALRTNASGEETKRLDAEAEAIVLSALREAPVAAVASEESDHAIALSPCAPLVAAVDPLDGSGNLHANGPMGLIFSLRPALGHGCEAGVNPEATSDLAAHFRRPGDEQVAAGVVVYGPSTVLALTTGEGVDLYGLGPDEEAFSRVKRGIGVPLGTPLYAVNSANARHWTPEFRAYVADLQAGAAGFRGRDFNMRWYGALCIEALRILKLGGVYLYPADNRPEHYEGRLRLVYEAHPVAMLVEQAGGAATDGHRRILEKEALSLHERTPFVFGSKDKVDRVTRYLESERSDAERQPLFARRGMLRD